MKSKEELKHLEKFISFNPMLENMRKIIEKTGAKFEPPTSYRIPYNDRVDFWILVSSDFGWEHVSVSLLAKCSNPTPIERCPKWDEMNFVKDLFWNDDEYVVQFHPAKKDYVNTHPYVLHLWRPIEASLPVPPKILV